METFTGKLSTDPERRDGRWHFSLYDEKMHEQISCMSSARFEAENQDIKLNIEPCQIVRVSGERNPPWLFRFDTFGTVKG
jgi:hypothetical protein